MSDDDSDGYVVDLKPLAALTTAPLFDLITELAPDTVQSRLAKAGDHYNKARALIGVDDEMGAIRLIAAEEELVVAIFRCVELTPDDYPGAEAILRHYKQHRIKLAFLPVLVQFIHAAEHLTEGFSIPGLEGRLTWKPALEIEGRKVVVRIRDEEGKTLIDVDPFSFSISRDDLEDAAVVPALLEGMRAHIKELRGLDLKDFIEERAVYRDRLLYAYDGTPPIYTMHETLEELFATFDESLRALLGVLALVLSGPPPVKTWGVVAQFIELYRRVLAECGFGKPPADPPAVVPDTHVQMNFTPAAAAVGRAPES